MNIAPTLHLKALVLVSVVTQIEATAHRKEGNSGWGTVHEAI